MSAGGDEGVLIRKEAVLDGVLSHHFADFHVDFDSDQVLAVVPHIDLRRTSFVRVNDVKTFVRAK